MLNMLIFIIFIIFHKNIFDIIIIFNQSYFIYIHVLIKYFYNNKKNILIILNN